MYLLVSFDIRIMQVCGDNMGLGSWESIQGLLMGCEARLPMSFGGIGLLYGGLCPIYFYRELGFGGFIFML
jgi:hypothetical protein